MSDFVPAEVVTEILSRLPVKSILKFRCVCKEWFFLISTPAFTAKHLSLSLSSSSLSLSSSCLSHTLIRHYSKLHSKEIYTVHRDPNFIGPNTRINFPSSGGKSRFYSRVVGYCNGILCLSDDLFGYNETIILWNPSIRRAINVPSPSVTLNNYGNYIFALGFGFDSLNSDYKIVRLAYFVGEGYKIPPKVEIFSVFSGKWRRVKTNIAYCITEHFWSQAVRDSVVHWVGFVPSGKEKGRNLIVSFDLGKEVFGEMGLPDCLENVPVFNMVVKMLRGSISVIRYESRQTKCGSCAIWVMRDYGDAGSWVNRYNVGVQGVGMILSMPREGEIFLSKSNGELVLYNCESATTKEIGICGTRLSFFVDEYVESLALMGMGREVRGRDPKPDYEDEDELVQMEENENLKVTLTFIISRIINTRLN